VVNFKTTNNNKEKNGRVTFYLLGAKMEELLRSGPHGAEENWPDWDQRSFALDSPNPSPLLASPGGTYTLRVKLETFRREGLFLDAVKWNTTDWEVVLQQRKGEEYHNLCAFPLGGHNFHADLTQDKDFTVTIPTK
jgi:hypothetical protein